jgi:hypothetical protein
MYGGQRTILMGWREWQSANNAESRGQWEVFGPHRAKVTGLLRDTPQPGTSRLCVLGAGNCNDLDLNVLLRHHREVHLVDLDAAALAEGVARQGLAGQAAIHQHGAVDVTGVIDLLGEWSPQAAVPDDDLARCASEPVRRVGPALPGPFEVAASTCLLSQLVQPIVGALGEAHPRFLAALQAIRAGQLRLLADLVVPGGLGVLIIDFVSSDSFAPLATLSEEALAAVAPELIRAQNFFHGANPAVLTSLFRTDPVVAPHVAALECARPWLWNLGPRVYAVCAWKFRKRATPVGTVADSV